MYPGTKTWWVEKVISEICSQVVNSGNTLKRSRFIFLYRQDAKISVTSSCVQARDYALYCTALILQELVMQVMHCLGQTYCCTQPPLSRADTARWKNWCMSHTLNQQHNLEYKLSLWSPDSSWLLLLEGPARVPIPIKTMLAKNMSDNSAWLYWKLI